MLNIQPVYTSCSYGYDPLGLGKDTETVAKYRANELLHARWAMLAAAGILIPEGLQANGANIVGGTWFETGAEMLNGGTLNYFAVPWGIVNNPLPLFAVTAIEVVLMGAVEFYRRNGAGPAGYSPGEKMLRSLPETNWFSELVHRVLLCTKSIHLTLTIHI